MQLTIIRDMGLVHVDGEGYDELDMSAVPTNVNALHWDSETRKGEIEYTDGTANEDITSLPAWANTAKAKRDEVKAVEDAEIAQQEAFAASPEGKAQAIRGERDLKLMETDWWANSDVTMTQNQRDYRQALRDVTNQSTFPESVTWPNKP